MRSIPRDPILTNRLSLRPSVAADIDRAFEIRLDWQVARMLSAATFPPDRQKMEQWFTTHVDEWTTGTAYRFAIERDGRMVGIIDLDDVTDEEAELGYWLEQAGWGKGYGFEAAEAVVRFGFVELKLARIRAGHAEDNPASGRILSKVGFRYLETVPVFSTSRGDTIQQRRYVLTRP